ncbi:MAG: PAS domain-containing protein [Methylobacterium mesophilicum]|nr:PAS domain-containing protein [Methylobacterium mesophilicum]
MSSAPDPLAFLAGGGEASRMIRERDWTGHPLGHPETWPDSLRAALSLILNSPESMILAWGQPDLYFFFNETYFPLLGPRLSWAMGERFDKVWADAWAQAKPIIDEAYAGRAKRFVDLPWKLGTDRGERDTWWTFSYSRVLDGDGAVAGLFIFTNETTARVLGDAALRRSEERFRAITNATADVIYRMNADWTEMQAMDGRGILASTDAPSVRWREAYLLDEDVPAVQAAINEAIESRGLFQLEHRVRQADGSIGWTLSRAIPILDDDGHVIEWFGTASDVTARHRADAHMRLMINELNHRVKNNLAIVQAIGAQTMRGTDDMGDARARFTSRVVALARTNDLLTGERGVSASLREVVELALGPHNAEPDRLEISGRNMTPSSKLALALSLALHELATNATKYGAWSNERGVVSVSWKAEDDSKGEPVFRLDWQERGGPAVREPERRGFGSRLIERVLAAEVDGTVRMAFLPEGLHCAIEGALTEHREFVGVPGR